MSRYTDIHHPPSLNPQQFFLDDAALFFLARVSGRDPRDRPFSRHMHRKSPQVASWQAGRPITQPLFSSARLKHKTLVSDSSRPYDQLPGQFRVPSTVIRSPRHEEGKTVPLLRGSYHHSDVA